jgi:hypothetical protein
MKAYELCKAPDCSGNVTDKGAKLGLCNRHVDMLKFILWALDNIKMKDKTQTDSGIILPK